MLRALPLLRTLNRPNHRFEGFSYVNVEWVSMLLNMEFNNLKFRYVSTRILTPSTFT